MPLNSRQDSSRRFPAGFTQHSGGLASEYAREQGWGINEDERTQTPHTSRMPTAACDYDYGPRDFGDTAVDTSAAQPASARPASARADNTLRLRPGTKQFTMTHRESRANLSSRTPIPSATTALGAAS